VEKPSTGFSKSIPPSPADSQISDTVSPFENKHEFYNAKSFQELAREQNVKPVANVADLAGVFSESDALDELLDEIYRERE
jgi:hypothetical protein